MKASKAVCQWSKKGLEVRKTTYPSVSVGDFEEGVFVILGDKSIVATGYVPFHWSEARIKSAFLPYIASYTDRLCKAAKSEKQSVDEWLISKCDYTMDMKDVMKALRQMIADGTIEAEEAEEIVADFQTNGGKEKEY